MAPCRETPADLLKTLLELVAGQLEHGRYSQRKAASVALQGVCSYLKCFKQFEDPRLRLPLLALNVALSELDQGITTPLLEPAPLRGRPKKSHLQVHLE